MSKVALVIIYNHKYDRNIPVVEELYGKRFSHIFHLVPFYTGNKSNVIAVYDNAFYFQGYVAQGFTSFYDPGFTHYLFIGDDLVLNPVIDENNYQTHFNLQDNTCFLPEFLQLYECNIGDQRWERVVEAFHFKPNNIYGVEAGNEYPDKQTAVELFKRHGLSFEPFRYTQINTPLTKPPVKEFAKRKAYHIEQFRKFKHRNKLFHSYYPLVGGYSDIFVVSGDVMKTFAHYCGVFATYRLFVEFAVPTAMALAAEHIILEKHLALKGKPLWTPEDFKVLDKYNFNLDTLVSDFPENLLYIHPVKLSKWHK